MREPAGPNTGSRAYSLVGSSRAVRQGKSNANLSIHHLPPEEAVGSDCAMLVVVVLYRANGLHARRCCCRGINARCRPRGYFTALGCNGCSQRSVGCDPGPIDDRHLEGVRHRGTGSVTAAKSIDGDARSRRSNRYKYHTCNVDFDLHSRSFSYSHFHVDGDGDGDSNANTNYDLFTHSDTRFLPHGNRSFWRIDAPNSRRVIPNGRDGRRSGR